MADFSNVVITAQGKSLLAKVQAEKDILSFTIIKTSDVPYSKQGLYDLTDIENPKQIKDINIVLYKTPNNINIESTLTNEGLIEGYNLACYGIYAKSKKYTKEILFAAASVDNINKADWVSPSGSLNALTINLNTTLIISDVEVSEVIVSNEGVSNATFNNHVNMKGDNSVHGATPLPEGGQIIARKEDGSAEINYPENPNATSIINKSALDEALANISVGADGVPQEQIINSFKLYKEYKKGDIIAINENGTTEDWNIGNPNPTETPTQPDTPSGEDKKEESGGTESGGTETPTERVKVVTVGETIQVGAAIYEAQDDVYEDEGFTDIRTKPTKYPDIWVFKRWALS